MHGRFCGLALTFFLISTALGALPPAAAGQNPFLPLPPDPEPPGEGIPDLNGVWDGEWILNNFEQFYGGLPPFTPYGLELWEKRDLALDPTGFCQPTGPARVWNSPFGFQLVQTRGQVTFLFEIHHTFHRVFTDGRGHPDPLDITWWGSSIGHYEGNKLIVETVGIDERSWLFTAGLRHSDQLELHQVFEKTGPDTIHYTVTYEDPVFFTGPWSLSFDFQRQEYDIMEMICTDNNRDIPYFVPSEEEP